MKMTRIYTGADKKSHFEDQGEVLLEAHEDLSKLSNEIDAKSVLIQEFAPNFHMDWCESTDRYVYTVFLEGQQEIQVADGEKRIFSAGDILLVEHSKGSGYCRHNVGNQSSKALNIKLE